MAQKQQHILINLSTGQVIDPFDVKAPTGFKEFSTSGDFLSCLLYLLAGQWRDSEVAIVGHLVRPGDLPASAQQSIGVNTQDMYRTALGPENPYLTQERHLGREVLEEYGLTTFHPVTKSFINKQGQQIMMNVLQPDRHPHKVNKALDVEDVLVVNWTKQEFLTPSAFGDASNLHDCAAFGNRGGILTGLGALLAASCRGGARAESDIDHASPLVGSWAGDRIGVIDRCTISGREALNSWENTSASIRDVLLEASIANYFTLKDGSVGREILATPRP